MIRHGRNCLVLTILSLSVQASESEPLFPTRQPIQKIPPSESRSSLHFLADGNNIHHGIGNCCTHTHTHTHHKRYSLSSNRRQSQPFHPERRRRGRFIARVFDGIGTRRIFSQMGSVFESARNARQDCRFLAKSAGGGTIGSDGKIPSSVSPKDGSFPSSLLRLLGGMLRKRPRWLRFPRVTRDHVTKFSTVLQYTALVVVFMELFLVLKDVIDEFAGDLQGFDQEAFSWGIAAPGGWFGNNRYALTKKSVRKIIAWLEKIEATAEQGGTLCPKPPNIAPAWMLTVAQELHNCKSLSLAEIQRILLELTNAEASLLDSCLLSANNKVDVNEGIGGLFAAKSATHQLLLSSLSALRDSHSNSSIPNNPSPYTKFVAKGSGNNDMVLWGPPGSGKSLLISAIAKSSGLPTLMITPSVMQRSKSLDGLFSLIETLGSCLVVLDDLDGLFMASPGNSRDYHEAAARNFKNEWLQRWDDLLLSSADPGGNTSSKCVLTIAATNRPWDVDTAAWRRLPNRVYIGLPNAEDRYDMLKKWSKDLPPIEDPVLQYLVGVTEGYIPSDLYQVLHNACQMGPIARQDSKLTMEDANAALSTVMPTRFSAQYIQQLQLFVGGNGFTPGQTPATQQKQPPTFGSGGYDFFSPHSVQALPYCENGYCWQTPLGNFYQFQIPVDSQVLAAIQTILLHSFEWGWSEDWDGSDYDYDDDEDEDDDFH